MAKYALLIYSEERTPEEVGEQAWAEAMQGYDDFTKDITERGLMLGGEALQPSPTATTVRVRDGQTLTTDGPFVETKEVLGGYYLVDCKDLDEAIAVAAKIPGALWGSIEVRPIWNVGEREH